MTITERDRRALILLGVAVPVLVAVYIWSGREAEVEAVQPTMSLPQAEQRLNRMRRAAAGLAGRAETQKKVAAVLQEREKGVIRAQTAAQAQAEALNIVRRVLKAQQPPIQAKASEMGKPVRLSDHYGEVSVSVSMECGIEQVVNLLADLANQPELISTREVQFGNANNKEKLVPVRLTVAAIIDPKLVPEKKEGPAF